MGKKTQKLDQSMTVSEMQQKSNYTNVDMLRFMRENGKMVRRIWED